MGLSQRTLRGLHSLKPIWNASFSFTIERQGPEAETLRGEMLIAKKARWQMPTGLCSVRTATQLFRALLASSMSLMPPTLLSTPLAS